MTWTAHHHRDDVIREIVEVANSRRDGVLPREIPGVSAYFADDLALVGALQLKWHTRLNGHIERAQLDNPFDLEAAVITGWQNAYAELGGVRLVLDGFVADPASPEMAHSLKVANAKDWSLMAAAAGLADMLDPAAAHIGANLEDQARSSYRTPKLSVPTQQRRHGLLDKLRSALAA